MKSQPKSFLCSWSIIALIFILGSCSNEPEGMRSGGGGEAYPELETNQNALKNWQNMRFGMFVHWGPVSLKGTEIGWSRGREIPFTTYDSLYHHFDPVQFNANEWISIAKDAGMKYFIITAKHHDGFCMYDTKYTDYNIMNTPIHRDLTKELELACEDQGILFGTYYSVLDWYHPDYPIGFTGNNFIREDANMKAYEQYLHNQVAELIRKYNTNILWFDGQWEDPWTHEMGMDLYAYCRNLKDELLINNRVDKGFTGAAKGMTDSVEKYAGDFGTPEQRIGKFNNVFPWESCITICQQWAWKPNDKMKTPEECIHTLIKTIGGDGNLLLNVGPMPDGRIEPRQVEVLKKIGAWVRENQEAIYGTRGGPYLPTDNLAATKKGKDIFLFVMDGKKEITLHSLPDVKVKKAKVICDQSKQAGTQTKCTVKFSQKLNTWTFEVSGALPSEMAYVIRVKTK